MTQIDNNITQLSNIIDGHRAACELFQQTSGNTLRSAIIQRDNRIAELEAANAAQAEQINVLQNQLAAAQAEVADLQSKVVGYEERIANLNAAIDQAQAQA